ncbi:MAG: hypothetical protein CMM07_25760 [Rhodopirellula sp.]|nr:hypothetical protein [Rhodopirellula sp.]
MSDEDLQNNTVKRRSGYTAIPNAIMDDDRLSIEARGVLGFLMTFKEGWLFRKSHIQKRCRIGRDKYYRILKELKDYGYLIVTNHHGSDGKFSGSEWEIIDNPKSHRVTEKPDTVEPDDGKPAHLRDNNLLRKTINKPQTPEGPDLFGEEDPEQEVEDAKPAAPDPFDEFWDLYPKKAGKKNARIAFEKALKRTDATTIIDGVKKYAAWLKAPSKDGFKPAPKHAQGWLTGDRWEDALEEAPSPKLSRWSSHMPGTREYQN